MDSHTSLLTEVLVIERELDEKQRMIDRARKALFGSLPPVRTYLNHKQLEIDVDRIRVEAAKTYLIATSK